MTKANSVEAEIDEIIIDWETDCRNGKYHHENESGERVLDWPLAVDQLRRQMLSVVKRNTLKLPTQYKSAKVGVTVLLTHDFWQALKNSRRDDDG